jgi:hypothetical protein
MGKYIQDLAELTSFSDTDFFLIQQTDLTRRTSLLDLKANINGEVSTTSIGALSVSNNLSDLNNVASARGNLGLGSVDNTDDVSKPVSTAQQAAIDLKANQNTTYTKVEVDANIANIVNSAPDALNTLNELAVALGNDENFSSTITTSISTKATIVDLTAHENDVANPHNVTAAQTNALAVSNNLSDLSNVTAAKTNLGLIDGDKTNLGSGSAASGDYSSAFGYDNTASGYK